MKPRTFFRLAFLFPYILWMICALIAFTISSSSQVTSPVWDVILMPVFFYAFGIFFWFIPYTLLATGMWIWSGNKSPAVLQRMALTAPLLLFVFLLIEVVLASLPVNNVGKLANDLLDQSLLLGGLSLVFGYLCVGFALSVYKVLKANKLIMEEMPPLQSGN
jgi:hypothetical protein